MTYRSRLAPPFADAEARRLYHEMLAVGPSDPYAGYLIYDSGARINNPSAPGTATEKGGTWNPTVGTFGISGNRIFCASSLGTEKMWMEAGAPCGRMQGSFYSPHFDVTTLFLIPRYIDDDNYLLLATNSGTSGVALYKKDGGSFLEFAGETSAAVVDGATVTVQAHITGNDFLAIVNGVDLGGVTLAADDVAHYLGATKVALGLARASGDGTACRASNIWASLT